jgi:hypothetical protein
MKMGGTARKRFGILKISIAFLVRCIIIKKKGIEMPHEK